MRDVEQLRLRTAPKIGLFSSAASDRSSCGCSATRPSATRSFTAIWPGRLSRSAPATAMPRFFRLRDSAWMKRSRLRTSTSTSPAVERRGPCPRSSRARRAILAIVLAMASASCTAGAVAWSTACAPVVRLLDGGRADRRPHLDIARRAGADRLVLDRLGIAGQPLARAARRQTRGRRPTECRRSSGTTS